MLTYYSLSLLFILSYKNNSFEFYVPLHCVDVRMSNKPSVKKYLKSFSFRRISFVNYTTYLKFHRRKPSRENRTQDLTGKYTFKASPFFD